MTLLGLWADRPVGSIGEGDVEEYRAGLRDLGAAYRDVMGRHFPAMTLVQVAALVEPEARLEIEATAIVPG